MLQELGLTGPNASPGVSRKKPADDVGELCCWQDRTKSNCVNNISDSQNVPFCNGKRYEDTMELHKELKQTAEQCQILADKLKRKGDNMNKPPDEPEKEEEKASNDTVLKLRATVAENIRLRQVLKDVTEVNKRWQKYNHDRQDYVQRLLSTIQELEKRTEKPISLSSSSVGRLFPLENERHTPISYRHSDPSLLDQSAEQAALRQSYESSVKENCRLHKEMEELRIRDQQLESAMKENEEETQLLKIQAKAFREDWEAEKREKETAVSKVSQLTEELTTLRKKCRDYEVRLRQIEQTCRCSTSLDESEWVAIRPQLSMSTSNLPNKTSKTPQFNSPREASSAPMPHVILRGAGNSASLDFSNDPNIVCDRPASSSPVLESLNEVTVSDSENVVECPGCKTYFPSSQHIKFLDHFEQCQRQDNG